MSSPVLMNSSLPRPSEPPDGGARVLRRVLFRADCGTSIGDGHVMRCLALAEGLAELGAECLLITANPGERAAAAWRQAGFAVERLTAHSGGVEDGRRTAAAARGADCLVVDGYRFDAAMWDVLPDAKAALLGYDDTGEDLPATIVVNQNPGATAFAGLYRRAGRALLGPRYASIRRAVRVAAHYCGDGVLICLGGATPATIGHGIAVAIRDLNPHLPVTLVGPGATAMSAALGLRLLEPAELAPLLSRADLVVCGAGVLALEGAYLGRAMVVMALADNQRPGAEAMAREGLARKAESPEEAARLTVRLMADADARRRLGMAARTAVDGHGQRRIHEALTRVAVP
jgi:spore coat polysaccharide biosynthesis predicted glycosyltransferase SpsG